MESFDQWTITLRQIKSSMVAPGPLTQLFPRCSHILTKNSLGTWIGLMFWAVKLSIYFENEEVGFDIFIIFLLLQIQGPGRRRKKTFFQKRGTVSPLMYQIFLSNMHRHYCCFVRTYYVSLSAEENHKNSLNHRKTRNFFVCLSVFHFDVISA